MTVSQLYEPQLNLQGFEDLDELQGQTEEGSSSTGPATDKSQSLKHSKSMAPNLIRIHSMNSSIEKEFNTHVSSMRIQELVQEAKVLRTINADQQKEIALLRQFIKVNFKSPELCGKMSDQRTKEALEKCFLDKPLVIMTFASPLVRIKYTEKERQLIEMDLLDYQKEFQCAIGGLKKTGNAVAVKRVHGTFERFQHVMSDHPVGMHFTGHGIINSFAAIGQDNLVLQNQGNCLVFETNDGLAHYITQDKLKEVVSATSLQFVFIASCHSQFAGEIFHNAGAEHVICVQQQREILDEAAIIFSSNFYELLFKETLTVCQAFFEAKKMLESHPDPQIRAEAVNLIIFKQKHDGRRHECKILGPYPTGQVELVRRQPYFPCDVARVDEFVGRQLDMQQILVCILNNRLTTLKGIPGIGKTTISRSVSWFLSERDIFDDGIIFISMRGRDQTSQLIQQIYQSISHNVHNVYSATQKVDNAFMYERVFHHLKDRCVLLVIDNLEDVLRNDRDNSREFLETLLQRNPAIKILATSREIIQDLGEITERVYEIKELSNNYTLQLLEKKALRQFDSQEIKELLDLKLSNKLSLAIGSHGETEIKIKRLEDHHLCDLLAGHPMTVSLWAPLLQSSTLSQLYQKMLRMMQSKNFIQNSHELNPVNSLKVSMDASVQYVKSTQPQAIDLFCLLGMMPGGATETDLSWLWSQMQGRQREWEFLTQYLKKYSLLVDKIEIATSKVKYQLLGPFMNKYAESLLNRFELREMQGLLIDYFIKLLRPMYLDCNVESKRSTHEEQAKIRNQQQELDTNFWACMYRICVGIDPEESSMKKGTNLKHKHLTVGYSSADEYESILIGEMTTDNEDDDSQDSSIRSSFPHRRTLTPIVRSASDNSSTTPEVVDKSAIENNHEKLTIIEELNEDSYAFQKGVKKAVKFQQRCYDSDSSDQAGDTNMQLQIENVDESSRKQPEDDPEDESQQKLEESKTPPLSLSPSRQRKGLLKLPVNQLKPSSNTLGDLHTIQETEDYLTQEGLFIVLFVSVNVLCSQYSQASRMIHLYCKSALFHDAICRANLVKLQGLIYFNERKFKQALQTFEQAQTLFQKKSNRIGQALCFSAQAMILYTKLTNLEMAEEQAFQGALDKFTRALQLYRDSKHVAGQAFCTKQLGHLKKKMLFGLKQYQMHFDEAMRLAQQLKKLIAEGKWIERYTGQENSLFIEIVGEKPATSKLQPKENVQATESIKWQSGNKLRLPASKTRTNKDSPKSSTSRSRESDYATDDDAFLSRTKITQMQKQRRDSIQAGIEEARKKFELKKQPTLQQQQQPAVFKNVANLKKLTDEMKAQKESQNVIQVQELPEAVKLQQSLPYSWAWKIDNTDPLYFKRQEKSLNWYFFDFEQAWQIEQYFQSLLKYPQLMRTDILHLAAKQVRQGQSNQYHIYCDPNAKRLNVDQQNTSLLQKNLKTKVTRAICRFGDRKCFISTTASKPQTAAKLPLLQKLRQVMDTDEYFADLLREQIEKMDVPRSSNWEGYLTLDNGVNLMLYCGQVTIAQDTIFGQGKTQEGIAFTLNGSIFKNKGFVLNLDLRDVQYTCEGAFTDTNLSQMEGVWHTDVGDCSVGAERSFFLKQKKVLQDLDSRQLDQLHQFWLLQQPPFAESSSTPQLQHRQSLKGQRTQIPRPSFVTSKEVDESFTESVSDTTSFLKKITSVKPKPVTKGKRAL